MIFNYELKFKVYMKFKKDLFAFIEGYKEFLFHMRFVDILSLY